MKLGSLFLALLASSCLVVADPGTKPDSENSVDLNTDRAMLGVATASVPPSLRDYLGLNPGFGIQIHDVVKGTPAAESGLAQNDILVQLDDQMLISPEHLALLINTRAPGDTVELQLIRQGERKKLNVTLGALDPEMVPTAFRPDLQAHVPHRSSPWQDQMRKQQEIWEQWMKTRKGSGPSEEGDGEPDRATADEKPGFPIQVFGKEGIVTIDNPNGSVTLETEGGETRITIRNGEEQVIHEGPFDSDTGVDGLPEEARKTLEKMKLGDLSHLSLPVLPRKKISAPMPPAMPPRIL